MCVREKGDRMLAELRMELAPDSADFGYFQSSNLHGVLMEQIDSGYAQTLHERRKHPMTPQTV